LLSIGSFLFNSLDYILIVDSKFNIIFNSRYDSRTNIQTEYAAKDILNKNFFDVYTDVTRENSSIYRCMTTGEIVVQKNQRYHDYLGHEFISHNVTLPIRRRGKIVGVVELAKDVEPLENVDSEESDVIFNEFLETLQRESGYITFSLILTRNPEMRKNIAMAKTLAKLPNPTLIYGETGTGKELFAQAMITQSGVPRSKVVVLNCATVPDNLMESILFGTKRGIYTGAENRRGLFEEADGGILFLDELNAIPYQVQAKLLLIAQDGTFRSLGDNRDKTVNVKIIASMNVEPEEAITRNILRKDLFYRFSSSIIRIQPLRKRKEDIDLFIEYYIKHFQDLYGKHIRGITGPLREALQSYRWEGNVRELKNVIELAVEFAGEDEILGPEHLPPYLHQRLFEAEESSEKSNSAENDEIVPLSHAVEDLEKSLILRALEQSAWNKTKAAERLGIPRQTLTYKIKQLKLANGAAKAERG